MGSPGIQRLAEELVAKTVEIAELMHIREILTDEIKRTTAEYRKVYDLLTPAQKLKLEKIPSV